MYFYFVFDVDLGNPYDVVKSDENNSPLVNWESVPNLTPLNLYYDVTPPELVSAVVTEVAILPCTSTCIIIIFLFHDFPSCEIDSF